MGRTGEVCEECVRNCLVLHQKQKDTSPIVTRFFKPMIGEDYNEVLFLPPCFARMVKHLANEETEIEDSNGDRWPVTCSYVNGSLAFQKGWHNFSHDHDLKKGELLLFNYIKGSHFVVYILGTSAMERQHFDNGRAPQKKRPRKEIQTIDVYSRDKTCQSLVHVANGDFGRGPRVSTGINMENDLTCMMINRDNGFYGGEDRNFLYDLSSFEREIETSCANKFDNVSHKKVAPSDTQVMEPAEMSENVLNAKTALSDGEIMALSNGEIMDHADKFEKHLDTEKQASHAENTKRADIFEKTLESNVAPSHSEATEHVDKFEKALEKNIYPSHTETMNHTRPNGDDIEMPVRKSQTSMNSDVGLSKDTSNDVPKFHNGNNHLHASDNESPSIGCSKIDKREYAVKRRLREYPSGPMNPDGKRNIKKELVESVEDANGLSKVSFGKGQTSVMKGGEIFPHVVKVEPDLSYETVGSVAANHFSAEVKSLSYLELPVRIPSIRGRKDRGRGKVVYLRDPVGRLWPLLYLNIFYGRALTANWRTFCAKNNIKLGDNCTFRVENSDLCIYKVDVTHRSG